MDLNRKIRDYERHFHELYLEAIPLLHQKTPTKNGSGHYLSFSTMFSGIECLASMLAGKQNVKNETGARFKKFVATYFVPPDYKKHADALWKLRGNLAHTFSTRGKFVLTNDSPPHHFFVAKDGVIYLNAETLLEDFTAAANRYFNDLRSVKGLRRKFELSVGQTGIIRGCVPLPELPKVLKISNQNFGTTAGGVGRVL